LGGLQGAIGQRADEVFGDPKLPAAAKTEAALRRVLAQLATVEGEGRGFAARRVDKDFFPAGSPERQLLDAFVQARLLVADRAGEQAQVRVAHEALFSRWEGARKLLEQDRQDLLLRARLEQAAARWRGAGRKNRDSLLLPSGLPLQEGCALLQRWGGREMAPEVAAYIRASRAGQRRRRVKGALLACLLLLILPAGYGARWAAITWQGVRRIEPEIAFAAIPAGCFEMGSPETEDNHQDDETQHRVCVEAFRLGKYEVTQAQWEAVMGDNPSSYKGAQNPVEMVDWHDAQRFARNLNWFGRGRYRLPTEAEWEYAARAGTATARYWGDEDEAACRYGNVLDEDLKNAGANVGAWFECRDGYGLGTAPAGSFEPNAFDLHDMLGNVFEWTCSAYVERYDGSESICTNDAGARRANRGGSWYNVPRYVRSAGRNGGDPAFRVVNLGFRLAQD
jgi:formylglycine-generating enzyme required for sulfatase activity